MVENEFLCGGRRCFCLSARHTQHDIGKNYAKVKIALD